MGACGAIGVPRLARADERGARLASRHGMELLEIMTTPVLTLAPSEPASDAFARMRDAGVRHAIVVTDGSVAGVVSERDLGGPLGGAVRRGKTVADLMQRDAWTARPDLRLEDAVRLMRERRIGCIPVVDDGELVGIVTRSDLLAALAEHRRRRLAPRREPGDVPRPPRLVSPNRDKRP